MTTPIKSSRCLFPEGYKPSSSFCLWDLVSCWRDEQSIDFTYANMDCLAESKTEVILKGNSNLTYRCMISELQFFILTFMYFNLDNSQNAQCFKNSYVYQYFKNYQSKKKPQGLLHHMHSSITFTLMPLSFNLPHFWREKKKLHSAAWLLQAKTADVFRVWCRAGIALHC